MSQTIYWPGQTSSSVGVPIDGGATARGVLFTNSSGHLTTDSGLLWDRVNHVLFVDEVGVFPDTATLDMPSGIINQNVDWANRYLISGDVTLSWDGSSFGVGAVLVDSNVVASFVGGSGQWRDENGDNSIDSINRAFYSSSGQLVINLNGEQLIDSGNFLSLDWTGRDCLDNQNDISIDFENRIFKDSVQTSSINYQTRILFVDNSHQAMVWSGGNISTPGHLVGAGSTPSIGAGAGAGTGPTISLSGSACSFSVTLTTGSLPTANATIATVTLGGSIYSSGCFPVFWAGSSTAAALTGSQAIFVTGTGTTVLLKSGSSGLTASTQYIWNFYLIGGR